MNSKILLLSALMSLGVGANAQDKVQQYFKVSDNTFVVNSWQDNDNPNESNPVDNSFTINCMFGAVAWDFGGNWWDKQGLDISGYDKLVIRLKSVVGNTVQFRISDYDALNGSELYTMPDDIVQMDEETEYEIDLTEDLERADGSGVLDKTLIKRFAFWNYWDVDADKTNPENDNYVEGFVDPAPGPEVTVTISALYLERTLKNGEKDYVDLLAANKFQFTDEFLADEGGSPSYIDNTGTIHMNENAEGGFFFDEEPADWSAYKYLVIVPKQPSSESGVFVRYLLSDVDDNVFDGGTMRWGWWNRPRAAVQDLTAMTTTAMDDDVTLDAFDTKQIASLKWSLWGGVAAFEYGLAGVWLSNTAPTYSVGFGDGTDATGDYVIDNTAEGVVSTLCLPYATALCGADVYEVAGVDDPANPTELYAKPHAGILAAGTPYIIRTNTARNVTAFRAGISEVSAPVANGGLVADGFTTYYVEADKNYLVLNADGDGFEAVTERSKRVNSNTAYIDCSKLSQAEEQENGLVFTLTGAQPFTPSGIAEVKSNATVKGDGKFYDLSGRTVTNPTKGLYILNGKKYVVK